MHLFFVSACVPFRGLLFFAFDLFCPVPCHVLSSYLSSPVPSSALLCSVRGHRGLSRSAAGSGTHDRCAHPSGIGSCRSRLLCVVSTPVRLRHYKNEHFTALHCTILHHTAAVLCILLSVNLLRISN